MPKVSIITPTYNSEKYVSETVSAIIEQTFSDWELIITDDCSSDSTCEIIDTFSKKDDRIKLFRLKINSGGGIARNNSIANATGRYIAFCDSDDVWLPQKLEKQLQFLQENDLAFTFSSYQKMDEAGERKGIIEAPAKVTYNDLLRTCSIGCLTAIYDTEKIGKVYMPEIRKRQDYGLWLKIFKIIGSTKGMSEVLANYRERTNSVSSNKFIAAQYHYRVLREVAKLPRLKASFYFLHYAFSGFMKYIK